MSPYRLALRTLLLGRTRSVLAILLITASLCVLDLFAGNIASTRAGIEYQAVIRERMGHLTVVPSPASGDHGQAPMFGPDEGRRVHALLAAAKGIALVMPKISVAGIAASAGHSAIFAGEGMLVPPEQAPPALQATPGRLKPSVPNGIAISHAKAKALALRNGSNLTLTAAVADAAPKQVLAQVVDVYNPFGHEEGGRSLLMPLELAQTLLNTEKVERFVVFLSDPAEQDQQRDLLAAALRQADIGAEVHTWQELSVPYMRARSASDLAFDSVAGMVFAVIAATIAATISINALERRREVGTLRALGMRSHSVFLMFVTEALGMAVAGVFASLIGSGLIAWIVNRVAQSDDAQRAYPLSLPVELDFNRMLMAVVAVLAVALMAALVPAFKAARASIAPALAA